MARILVTGAADGLGKIAAQMLITQGHSVVLHARNPMRGEQALEALPGAEGVVTGDLSRIEEIKDIARQANASGHFNAIIHNAGVYRVSSGVFTVNSLAPYILTCLINRPDRLIYLSSGLHMQGSDRMDRQSYQNERFTYSDTKLHVLLLAKALTRMWPGVYANAVNPGWVPTKMGGSGAPDDLMKGAETQVWLATSNEPEALVSGRYFFHKKERNYNPLADDEGLQDRFLELCGEISGTSLRKADTENHRADTENH
ncbi:MAG TPA: SDR family NAD(P)-dependent oxidoreductase [Bacteroidales bacterium]|nr:SDR family NAD(P)-dependent oxidoreductase [Bacteroidales bacterium]